MKKFLLLILLLQTSFNGYSDVPRLVKFEARLFLTNNQVRAGFFYVSAEELYNLFSSEGMDTSSHFSNDELLSIIKTAYLYNDTLSFFIKVYSLEGIGEAALTKDILYIPRSTILNAELIKLHSCVDEGIEGVMAHIDCFDSYPMTQFNTTDIDILSKNKRYGEHESYPGYSYAVRMVSCNPAIGEKELEKIHQKVQYKESEGSTYKEFAAHYKKLKEELR